MILVPLRTPSFRKNLEKNGIEVAMFNPIHNTQTGSMVSEVSDNCGRWRLYTGRVI